MDIQTIQDINKALKEDYEDIMRLLPEDNGDIDLDIVTHVIEGFWKRSKEHNVLNDDKKIFMSMTREKDTAKIEIPKDHIIFWLIQGIELRDQFIEKFGKSCEKEKVLFGGLKYNGVDEEGHQLEVIWSSNAV